MPEYLFQHPQTKEVISLFQKMKDLHEYTDEEGVEWKRILTSPQVNGEAPINPWSNSDFVEKTGKMKGSYGDILDKSKELSEMRASQNEGVDPVKEKYFDKYAESRKGARHLSDTKPLDNKNVRVDY